MAHTEPAAIPIDRDVIERAKHEHSRPDDDIENLSDFFDVLDAVQLELQNNMGDLHSYSVNGAENIEAWGTTLKKIPDSYVFIGDLDWRWKRVFDSAEVSTYSVKQMIRDAHRWQAEKYGVETEKDAMIVAKPINWVSGESAARNEITGLLEKGLTPSETLDLWLNEYGHSSQIGRQSKLSERRGVSQQAVSQNIRQAKKKLEAQETAHLTGLDPHTN